MCHLILLMPVLALPVFWLMPVAVAAPIYIVIALISALVYWLIARTMGKRPETGSESLVGAVGQVVSRLGAGNHTQYLVRFQGELWTARSPELLEAGEMVSVNGVKGIRLLVCRNINGAAPEEAVGKKDGRHCH